MPGSTTDGVVRHVLDNGLTLLVKPNRAAPVAATVAHVRVGYFNEPDRWSGISHVIEHMLFKGTWKRPGKEQIAQDVRALGGTLNAGTAYEETSYYIVLPSAHIEEALEIQADMLQASRIDADELAREIEVIIQESKQKRDNPGAMLVETLYARAYDHHRIRRWRIGDDETLRALRRDDLASFLDQTYRPENMTLCVVGDVDVSRSVETVNRVWGDVPRGELHRELSPDEPAREGFRYHRMRGEIQQRLLVAGFPTVPVLDADSPALAVLAGLLGDGRSSRLYRSLKEERRLVNSVWADQDGFNRMGLFTLGAESAADDPLPAAVGLFEEVSRLTRDPIRDDELARVKTRIESRRLYAQEEVLGMARTLAWYEALGDYHLADEMLDRLRAVSADDLLRVAGSYLTPDRATLVEYLPSAAAAAERDSKAVESSLRTARFGPVGQVGEVGPTSDPPPAPEILILPSGATVIHKRRQDLPIVALHMLFPGGRVGETERIAGLTNLMLKSCLKGTATLSAAQISERIEGLGSGIGLTLAPDYFGFSLKILARRLEEGLEVLREVVSEPAFSEEEVQKEKEAIYAEIRRHRDSMFSWATELLSRACFGESPYGLPSSGLAEAVERFTSEDLRVWHRRCIGSGAVIGVVGDLEAGRLADLLAEVIPGRVTDSRREPSRFLSPREEVAQVDRHQTAALLGFEGAPIESDDRHALDLIAEITSGMAGRFFQAVRGDRGLAYAVTSFHRSRRDAGLFGIYTATSPDNEVIAREIILQECARLAREDVPDSELVAAREALRGEQLVHSQTFGAQAGELAGNRLYGLPIDETERYLKRIDSITSGEIREAAARYLRTDRMWLGAVRGVG